MDHVVAMNLSTWQDGRTRDPRRLVLGSAQWGMPYGIANHSGPPDSRELEAMLVRARDAGIQSIDTARAYGDSEQRVGELTGRLSSKRLPASKQGWRIITKLAPDAHQPGLGIGETLERVATSLAQSRAALGRETLPVVLLHRFAHRHACGGKLWRTLLAERDAGRIGVLGVSAGSPEEAWAALEDPDIEALQVPTSLLDLRLLRQGFFTSARERGRTIYVRSLFLQGVAHLGIETLPGFLAPLADPIRTIRATARALGVSTRALYLAFARECLPGARPVIGCESEAQLAEVIGDWTSSEPDVGRLMALVDALPTHADELVDPARWPTRPTGVEVARNQTARASVATIPA